MGEHLKPGDTNSGGGQGDSLVASLLQDARFGLRMLRKAPGFAALAVVTRIMASLLYQVSPTDIWTFVLVSSAVLVFILLACYVPSRRATRVDPNLALRQE